VVRGQFNGYKKEKGVVSDSLVETFAAVQLEVDSWRWKRVPFYIRAGKCLPATCAEIVVRLRQPPTMYEEFNLASNYFRFRISPEITSAFGVNRVPPGDDNVSEAAELIVSRHPRADEMAASERVLGDAMAGDAMLFARERLCGRGLANRRSRPEGGYTGV
jgi:glucose-6-phosphate 1-dehydrogenase